MTNMLRQGVVERATISSGGGGVTSLNALTGALSLTSVDSSITITPTGSTIDLKSVLWNGQANLMTGLFGDSLLRYSSVSNAWVNLGPPSKGNYYLQWTTGGGISWVVQPSTSTPSWSGVLTQGSTSGGVNPRLSTTDRLEFRDANKYIYSDATTSLTVVSDGAITFTPSTNVIITEAKNIQFGTTTGTKIGTATTQKIGFYNATPIVQPFAMSPVTALTNLGLLASPTAITLAQGGTNSTSLTANRMLYSDATSILSASTAIYNVALASVTPIMNFSAASSSLKGFALTGAASNGTSDTEGVFIGLSNNGSGNRQIQIGDTNGANSDPCLRAVFLSGFLILDAVSKDGITRNDLYMATDTSNLIDQGNFILNNVGKAIYIKEGAGGFLGQTTLSSGTVTITISGLTTSDRAFVQLATTGGTLGNGYKAACTANTLTITSVVAAGTTQTLDTSTINYIIYRPAP